MRKIEQYQAAVIELFKSGKATDEQWREMSAAVLIASERDEFDTKAIDAVIDPRADEPIT